MAANFPWMALQTHFVMVLGTIEMCAGEAIEIPTPIWGVLNDFFFFFEKGFHTNKYVT